MLLCDDKNPKTLKSIDVHDVKESPLEKNDVHRTGESFLAYKLVEPLPDTKDRLKEDVGLNTETAYIPTESNLPPDGICRAKLIKETVYVPIDENWKALLKIDVVGGVRKFHNGWADFLPMKYWPRQTNFAFLLSKTITSRN